MRSLPAKGQSIVFTTLGRIAQPRDASAGSQPRNGPVAAVVYLNAKYF
jgi:hypothetical protein